MIWIRFVNAFYRIMSVLMTFPRTIEQKFLGILWQEMTGITSATPQAS